MPKNDKKLQLCWKFEKKIFIGCFSENCVLTQKVALETLSPVLTTLLTIFRQKSVFSTNIWKIPPPRPCPPFWKNYQTEHLSGDKNFSRRSVSGQIKTQFWQSAFKVQETSAGCLEKVMKTLIQPRKKTVYLKKPSWIVPSCFDNHAEAFWKQYVFLFLIFTKTDRSISEKKLSNCLKFSRYKNLLKKIL